MRTAVSGLVLTLFLLPAGCAREDVEEPRDIEQSGQTGDTIAPSEVEEVAPGGRAGASGQAVFSANCATCHGQTGRGDGPAAVGLEPPPADLTDGTWVTGDGSLAAIRNVVENGSPGTAMIGWRGTLSDAELEAVSRHIQSLSR